MPSPESKIDKLPPTFDNFPMPIYEFRCADCGKITNHFTRKIDTELKVPCEYCKSKRTSRMMSKFGRSYSRADIIEKYGDPSEMGSSPDAYRDPRQIGSWVEKKFDEYGMDLPEGAREMIDAAREGEFPDPVKDL
jgi:putative FmdB family regulatory protein